MIEPIWGFCTSGQSPAVFSSVQFMDGISGLMFINLHSTKSVQRYSLLLYVIKKLHGTIMMIEYKGFCFGIKNDSHLIDNMCDI